jgi:hypothetical protein
MLLQEATTSTSTSTAASAQLFIASVHYDPVFQHSRCAKFLMCCLLLQIYSGACGTALAVAAGGCSCCSNNKHTATVTAVVAAAAVALAAAARVDSMHDVLLLTLALLMTT